MGFWEDTARPVTVPLWLYSYLVSHSWPQTTSELMGWLFWAPGEAVTLWGPQLQGQVLPFLCDPKPSVESAPPRVSNSGALEHWGADV